MQLSHRRKRSRRSFWGRALFMLLIFLTLILAVTVGLYFQLSTIYEPYVPIHEERAPVETVWGPVQLNPVWRGKS